MNALGNLYNDITNGISNILPDSFKEAFGGSPTVDNKAASDTVAGYTGVDGFTGYVNS